MSLKTESEFDFTHSLEGRLSPVSAANFAFTQRLHGDYHARLPYNLFIKPVLVCARQSRVTQPGKRPHQ